MNVSADVPVWFVLAVIMPMATNSELILTFNSWDKAGIIHSTIGKASFSAEDLQENFLALLYALHKAKPASAKGQYFKRVAVSTTMGPGIRVDRQTLPQL